MKKGISAALVIAALLAVGYLVRPGIKSATTDYLAGRIDAIAHDQRFAASERRDNLLALSLDFRQEKKSDLSWRALAKADSLMPDQPLTQGLIGLFHLEAGHREQAIESWRKGAEIDPGDPNLSYLATLDTLELASVDNHMLEKMFVDTLVNAQLKTPLYHQPDTEISAQTEQNLRIQSSVNTTYMGGAALALIAIYFSVRRMRKTMKMMGGAPQTKKESKDAGKEEAGKESRGESGGESEKAASMPKSVGYIVVISCILKVGQILAAVYRYLTLGSNVSNFVSKYILIPENLWDLFTSNIVFALIFIVLVAWAVFYKKLASLV